MISREFGAKTLPWLLAAALALAVALLYGPFLHNPFVFDDNNFFDGAVNAEEMKVFLQFDARWLPYSSFEWTRIYLPAGMLWLRLGNMLLHMAVAGVLFLFLLRLFRLSASGSPASAGAAGGGAAPLWLAFAGALIFALHPAAVYGVAYLIQRSTLMATLFTLLTWLFFAQAVSRDGRWRPTVLLAASLLAYFWAMMSKEHCIMAPALTVALVFLLSKTPMATFKRIWPVYLGYALIAFWMLYQLRGARVLADSPEPRADDMLAMLSRLDPSFDPRLAYPLSILTQCLLFFKYLLVWLLPNPAWMSVDMFESFAMRLWSWPYLAGLLCFVAYFVVAARMLMQGGTKGLFGFALLCPWAMFATELSTVRLQETFVLYRSYLWMPGLLAALPFVFERVSPRRAAVALSLLAAAMVPITWSRLTTFSSGYLLWNDAARLIGGKDARPGVERIYHNRGLELLKNGYIEEAMRDFNKALAINPRHALAFNDRGAAYLQAREYALAVKDFDRAIELNPHYGRSYLGRGLAYRGLNQPAAAARDLDKWCSFPGATGCEKNTQGHGSVRAAGS